MCALNKKAGVPGPAVDSNTGNGELRDDGVNEFIEGYIRKIEFNPEYNITSILVEIPFRVRSKHRPYKLDYVDEEKYKEGLKEYMDHVKRVNEYNAKIKQLHLGEVEIKQRW